jgi:hypothetical protein
VTTAEVRQTIDSMIAEIEEAWPQAKLLAELANAPDDTAVAEITERYVVVANAILAKGGSRCRFALSTAADEDVATSSPEPLISEA